MSIKWINIMKGIGIISVVAGHIFTGEISRFIYLFHMPLFFFLSGYLFKQAKDIKTYFFNKVIHLLVPYFTYLIPLYFLSYRVNIFQSSFGEMMDYLTVMLYGGRQFGGILGVFWFVTCLFLTQQVYNLSLNLLSKNKINILMIFLLILGYINSYYFREVKVPWNANVLFVALPIFHIGYLYKVKLFKANFIIIGLIGIILTMYFLFFENLPFDMKSAYYGYPILTLLVSFIFIENIKNTSIYLEEKRYVSLVLVEIGKATMVIMYLHQAIQLTVFKYVSTNMYIRFVLTLSMSYLFYLLINRNIFLRSFLLGSKKDMLILVKKIKVRF